MSDQATLTETVTLTIDGHEVTVPKGTSILEAAKTVGTEVPHYCYHPELSRPAQCRLCLVEVEGAPKLQPSCVTPVMPGQVVRTQSEAALTQRQGVLEFYLKNHPLDCPICDQSGECKLQDYVHEEGRAHGRSQEPKRVFGRDDFGGDVLFYGDRCVMCTRCVRFMNEVAGDPPLTVVERGNRSVIDTFFEEGLNGSPYAGNIVDICPVGALVSKDFLFKARAWDLTHTPSICPNCSQGCNIDLHVRDNEVQRLKPRANAEVNQHWMCDYGRARYEGFNAGGRLVEATFALAPGDEAGVWEALGARLASARAEGIPVRAVASPFASNEELWALRKLMNVLGGGTGVFRLPMADAEIPLPGSSTLARRRELAPNGKGAELLGFSRVGGDAATGGLEELEAFEGVILVLGDRLEDASAHFASKAHTVVYLGTHPAAFSPSERTALLPIQNQGEGEGTFTNVQGRVQRFFPGLSAPGEAKPGWWSLLELVRQVEGRSDAEAPGSAAAVFLALASEMAPFAGLSYEGLGHSGALLNDPVLLPRG
jgi:NADH-quinone oxidoreductase subunit G